MSFIKSKKIVPEEPVEAPKEAKTKVQPVAKKRKLTVALSESKEVKKTVEPLNVAVEPKPVEVVAEVPPTPSKKEEGREYAAGWIPKGLYKNMEDEMWYRRRNGEKPKPNFSTVLRSRLEAAPTFIEPKEKE